MESASGEQAPQYEYTPLKENEIRLLEIIPADPSEPLRLRLHTVSLNNPPTYGALSYSWGTDMSDRTVFVDGKSLTIKPNLEAALLQFRCSPPFKVFGIEKLWNALELSNHVFGDLNRGMAQRNHRKPFKLPNVLELMEADNLTCARLASEKVEVRDFHVSICIATMIGKEFKRRSR